ncbi:MAG: hypothetical protein R3190_15795, partial [Thermoanaerobaculia bacterium]|nr:hypothetical protein [Thermoanaerobaculia bacterium]
LAAAGDREIDAAAVAVGEERLPEIRAVQKIQTREAPRLLRGSRTLLALAPLLARMPFLVRWLTRRRIAMRTGFSELELRV